MKLYDPIDEDYFYFESSPEQIAMVDNFISLENDKLLPINIECTKCEGSGNLLFYMDSINIYIPCERCMGTGKVQWL